MPLERRRDAFDDPEWIFELKYDGFRALLSVIGSLGESVGLLLFPSPARAGLGGSS